MREHYMLDGEGFLLVYSITERDSFKMIESYHQQILRVKDTQAVPIIVVGNKSDLECERRVDMVGASHLSFILHRTFDWRHVGIGGIRANIHMVDIKSAFTPSHVRAEGKGVAEKLGCRFVETSAKLGSNVTESFIDLVCEIRDRNRVGFLSLFGSAFFSSLFFHMGQQFGFDSHFAIFLKIISSRLYRGCIFSQELLEMRRVIRPITPDSAIQLPGAGCWNKGCTVS